MFSPNYFRFFKSLFLGENPVGPSIYKAFFALQTPHFRPSFCTHRADDAFPTHAILQLIPLPEGRGGACHQQDSSSQSCNSRCARSTTARARVHFTFLGSLLNLNRNLNLCRLCPKWSEIKIRIKIKIKKRQPKKMKCTPRAPPSGKGLAKWRIVFRMTGRLCRGPLMRSREIAKVDEDEFYGARESPRRGRTARQGAPTRWRP